MPNWCSNSLVFYGEENKIQQVSELFGQMQKECETLRHGTLPTFCNQKGDDYFFDIYLSDNIQYETRWSPNFETVKKIADHFELDFILYYDEPGGQLYGEYYYFDKREHHFFVEQKKYDLWKFNEEDCLYYFEGNAYQSEFEILEILLDRRKESDAFFTTILERFT